MASQAAAVKKKSFWGFGIKILSILLKKIVPSHPFLNTWPVDWKQKFFLVWPYLIDMEKMTEGYIDCHTTYHEKVSMTQRPAHQVPA